MKVLIHIAALLLFPLSLPAQSKDVTPSVQVSVSSVDDLVKACNAQSSVTMMTKKMTVPSRQLPPHTIDDKGRACYKLVSKTKMIFVCYEKTADGRLTIWTDKNTKYCFTLLPQLKWSLRTYTFNGDKLEIYGRINSGTSERNFRIIFEKGSVALFDFDDYY